MESIVSNDAKNNKFCQNFRHASAHHHQWLNEKEKEENVEGGEEGKEAPLTHSNFKSTRFGFHGSCDV